MQRYEDEHYYYVRKPAGIPTSVGVQFSFLEQIESAYLPFFAALVKVRSREDEYGLLNRLDNETAGLLYFAKTRADADRYYVAQDAGEVTKRYLCDVKGNVLKFHHTDTHVMWTDSSYSAEKVLCVSYPLMHHIYDDQKMIVIRQPRDTEKGRGKQHMVKTYFLPLYYDEQTDTTTLYAIITKGMRHQIRAHASSIGYALIGDELYKGASDDHLHLRSVGLTLTHS